MAEKKSRIVGCCALEVYSKKLAEIRSLTVEPAASGKGIASALLDICLKEARCKRVYEVLVITNKDRLFRRRGFSQQLHDQKALFLRP